MAAPRAVRLGAIRLGADREADDERYSGNTAIA
jgi:hypothetical protein